MTKIEDVARAIYEGRNGTGCKAWSRLPKAHQEPYLSDARAAIKAMREVDNEALEAMWHAMFVGEFTAHELPMLGAGWEAAIDAALSEEGE